MNFYEDLAAAMENLTKRGAFLTVKDKDGTVNTMTISWGYIGFSWNRPFFVAMVRPQRYTHQLLETADSYTISIPYTDELKKALGICGSQSGKDVDKEAAAGIKFLPAREVSAPVVAGCQMYYECRLTYADTIHPQKLPGDIAEKVYQGDRHDLYYGEIAAAYQQA